MKTSSAVMHGTQKLLALAVVTAGLWVLFAIPAHAAAGVPVPLEIPIGNITEVAGLEQYLSVLYEFIISAIAILSVVMMMFNGMRWATAGGSSESVGVAKEGVISAIIGLLIALMSFTLLNVINPALVNFLNVELSPFTADQSATESGPLAINGCSLDTRGDALIDYVENAESTTTTTKSGVPAINPCSGGNVRPGIGGSLTKEQVRTAVMNAHGSISPILFLAEMKAESNYCSNAYSSAGACGVVQMLPDTARDFAAECGLTITYASNGQIDQETTCNTIIQNPAQAICMMGKYLNQINNTSHSRENNEADVAAGYNGGVCGGNPKNGALCDSTTCQGLKYWECEDNTGYSETRSYVVRIARYKDELCQTLGGQVIERGETVPESDGQCVEYNSLDPDCVNNPAADNQCDLSNSSDPDCTDATIDANADSDAAEEPAAE